MFDNGCWLFCSMLCIKRFNLKMCFVLFPSFAMKSSLQSSLKIGTFFMLSLTFSFSIKNLLCSELICFKYPRVRLFSLNLFLFLTLLKHISGSASKYMKPFGAWHFWSIKNFAHSLYMLHSIELKFPLLWPFIAKQ